MNLLMRLILRLFAFVALSLPGYVKLWFVTHRFHALGPPLQWAARGADPIFGAPMRCSSFCRHQRVIAASVVTAYLAGRQSSPDGAERAEPWNSW